MPGKATHGDGTPIKVTVVDRRHHAAPGEEEAAAGQRSPYPSFIEELKARTEAAERRAREAIGRAEAEIDAVRERLQRDVDRRVVEGRSRLLARVIDVADNLDRAADAASRESEAVAQGIDLIRQQMIAILRDEGVEPIACVGEPFDPNVAEAVMVEKVDPARDNQVLEEIQRGYRLGDTILRPARVRVGKA